MFSQKLKRLRKQHGLTQAQLASELGIGVSTIGMYESNIRNPSYEVLKKISNYFNVSIDYLINEVTDENTCNLDFFIEHIKQLTPSQRKQIEDLIEFLLNKYPK